MIMNISQMITKTIPITTRIVISYAMKLCYASCFEFDGKSMETGTTTLPEFPNGGKAIKEQIIASEERNKSKRAGMWERQSGIWVGELTIWVRWFEIKKNYIRVYQIYHFDQNRLASPSDGRWSLKASSMLNEITSKTVHKDECDW